MILLGGLFLLGLCLFAGGLINGTGTSSMVTVIEVFNPICLGTALFNMGMGVAQAGHSVGEEFPILLVIVVITAAVALLIWGKFL